MKLCFYMIFKKTATVNLVVCDFIQVIKCPVLLVYVMGYDSSYLQQYCVSYLSADISKSSVSLPEQPGARPKASGGARLSGAEQPTRLRRCRVTKQTLNHRRGRVGRKTSSKLIMRSQCFLIHNALKLQILKTVSSFFFHSCRIKFINAFTFLYAAWKGA